MVHKKRLSVGLLALTLTAAAWAPGCGSSDGKAVNSAGSAGEAGAAEGGAGPGEAGAFADGGTTDGGEPSLPEAGSPGQAGEAGASGEPDPRVPFAEWDAARAQAQCAKDVACGKTYAVPSCVAGLLNTAPYDAFYGGADYYGNQSQLYTLASASVQNKCLADIAAGACGARPPASCSQVLVPVAAANKGEPCKSSSPYLPSNPCATGLECQRTLCPVCIDEAPLQELNGACDFDFNCKAGLNCIVSGNTATCQVPRALGQPCQSPSDCAEGTCAGTCKAYVLDGKACSQSAPCLPGLVCGATDNLCHPNPALLPGQTCQRHSGESGATCIGWCVFAGPEAATGKCGAPETTAPSACSRLGGSAALGCPFGSFVDAEPASNADGISDSCTCQPRRALGEPCTSFLQCQNGRCVAGENGSVCTKRLTTGATCVGAGDCEGSCNPETKKCDPVAGTCQF